ncbi:MAG TPA: methylated-DNA--[protein]-cysteine S-methyltransferase [Burkholderiaceae bacterium]|nr:methylated-DNA--[protein]-cysteine S-methyltransferase [Burkholderiaceae bacterium]
MNLKQLPAACTAQLQIATPLGPMLLARTGKGLAGAWFAGQKDYPVRVDAPVAPNDPLLCKTAAELGEYFAGRRKTFDIALDLYGTPFQRSVWQALLAIACGQTSSYGAVARTIGKPSAVRAVGAAVGANPVAVIVPCHRVMGSDGSLTGYAGGLPRKIALLEIEGIAALQPRLPGVAAASRPLATTRFAATAQA